MKNKINTEKAPAALGPYSQAVEVNGFVYTSGQLGIIPATGELVEGLEGQTRQVFENLKAVLGEAGADFGDVVKSLVLITDMGNFAKVNEIYASYVSGDVLPARSCVEISALPKGGLVEIEMIAVKK